MSRGAWWGMAGHGGAQLDARRRQLVARLGPTRSRREMEMQKARPTQTRLDDMYMYMCMCVYMCMSMHVDTSREAEAFLPNDCDGYLVDFFPLSNHYAPQRDRRRFALNEHERRLVATHFANANLSLGKARRLVLYMQ